MSLILTAILICTTFTSTVLAAETAPLRLYMSSGEIAREQAYFDSLSRDELIQVLMTKYGATETEAERLVDLAYENTQPYSARAKAFPSNPSIGQTCVIDVTIHVDDAATAAGIASEIMAASPYVTLAAALYAANILLTAGSMIYGYTVVLHISYTYGYTYGYTNDGVLGWTPGYVSYEIY